MLRTHDHIHRWLPWLLVLVGFAIYLNTLGNPFVFDTPPAISRAADAAGSLEAFIDLLANDSRRVANATLVLNYVLEGDEPRFYHLVNILIHVLTACTLLGVVRRTLQWPDVAARLPGGPATAPWLAGAVALLWLAHPLNTSAVTYVVQRHESLMALFYLLTLYCVVRCAEAQRARTRLAWIALAGASMVLGMGSKPVMVTAPLVALLFDRQFFATSFLKALRLRWPLHLTLWAAWGVMVLPTATGVVAREGGSAGFGMIEVLPPSRYFLSQGEVLLHYLRLSIVPWPLVLDYSWIPAYPERPVQWIPGFVSVGLLGVLTLIGLIGRRWWGFLGALFFLVLAPTSSFMPIADLAFEHRMYLPLTAVLALLVLGGWWVLNRLLSLHLSRAVALALVLVVAVVFSGLTIARNFEYSSPIKLWSTVADRAPYNARGWHNLASALATEDRMDEALRVWRHVLELRPDYAGALDGVGALFVKHGRAAEGLPMLQRAVELDPTQHIYRYDLAEAYRQLGQIDEAMVHLREALDLNPGYAKAHNNLAVILLQRGEQDVAVQHLQAAIEADPELTDAWLNLGRVALERGEPQQALGSLQRAMELEPLRLDVLTQLAAAQAQTGQLDAALQTLRQAVAQDPTHLPAISALRGVANLFAQAGRPSDAAAAMQLAIDALQRAGAPQDIVDALRQQQRRLAP